MGSCSSRRTARPGLPRPGEGRSAHPGARTPGAQRRRPPLTSRLSPQLTWPCAGSSTGTAAPTGAAFRSTPGCPSPEPPAERGRGNPRVSGNRAGRVQSPTPPRRFSPEARCGLRLGALSATSAFPNWPWTVSEQFKRRLTKPPKPQVWFTWAPLVSCENSLGPHMVGCGAGSCAPQRDPALHGV